MKTLWRIFFVLCLLYGIACAILFIKQQSILFYPKSLPQDHVYRKGVEKLIEVDDGILLSCYWNKVQNPKGVILYLHGNKGNNRRCIRQSEMMERLGYDIFMPDYRGFGKSQGALISDEQFYQDAQTVYDFLKENYTENQIVIVGYSMGSGPATYLAGINKPKELFLLSPFKSIVDIKDRYIPIAPDFLIKFKFPNWKYLSQTTCPITMFYASEDTVVNPASTLALADYSDHEELIELKNTSHRGVIFNSQWKQKIQRRLSQQ